MTQFEVAMTIDKAGCKNSCKCFDIISGFIFINDVKNNTRIVCYQYFITGKKIMPGKNLICLNFSIQNDWLICFKFADLYRSDNFV